MGSFWQPQQVSYMSNCAHSVKIGSKIAYKMSDLGYPLRMGNGMSCYEEKHSLLMKWFITFFRCIQWMIATSDSLKKLPIAYFMPFLHKLTLKFHTKCQIWGTLALRGNEILWYKKRQSLPLKWFKPILVCIRNAAGAYDLIHTSHIVHIESFLLRPTLK